MFAIIRHSCLVGACAALLAGCAGDEFETPEALVDNAAVPELRDAEIAEFAARMVHITVADPAMVDGETERELDELRYRLARTAFGVADGADPRAAGERIEVIHLGKGVVADFDEDGVSAPTTPVDGPDDPRHAIFDGFSIDTGNEYRIRVPRGLLRRAGELGEAMGINAGSRADDPDAERVPKGWSDNDDGRTLKGSLNTAHTSTTWEKLADTGGCSGTLVGPKHTLSAAHCVWNWTGANTGNWIRPTIRAGRNGTAWRAEASTASNTWFWVPNGYRASASNPETGAFDIGMWVTHADRLGETGVGWFGWVWNSTDSGFLSANDGQTYNRGYPACGNSLSPANCQTNHLYGDVALCDIGNLSSADSNGDARRFKHSCDTSGAQSGSPLYRYSSGLSAWVVSAVHTGRDGTGSHLTNKGTRITQEYSDSIVWLRNTFP